MELETAFLAQGAEVLPDGRVFVLGGGVEGFALPGLPFPIPSMAIVMRFHFADDECGVGYQVRVTITNPNGEDSGLLAALPLNPVRPETFPERGVKVFAVVNVTYFMVTQFGLHRVNVSVNEAEIGGFTFGIQRMEPPVVEAR